MHPVGNSGNFISNTLLLVIMVQWALVPVPIPVSVTLETSCLTTHYLWVESSNCCVQHRRGYIKLFTISIWKILCSILQCYSMKSLIIKINISLVWVPKLNDALFKMQRCCHLLIRFSLALQYWLISVVKIKLGQFLRCLMWGCLSFITSNRNLNIFQAPD